MHGLAEEVSTSDHEPGMVVAKTRYTLSAPGIKRCSLEVFEDELAFELRMGKVRNLVVKWGNPKGVEAMMNPNDPYGIVSTVIKTWYDGSYQLETGKELMEEHLAEDMTVLANMGELPDQHNEVKQELVGFDGWKCWLGFLVAELYITELKVVSMNSEMIKDNESTVTVELSFVAKGLKTKKKSKTITCTQTWEVQDAKVKLVNFFSPDAAAQIVALLTAGRSGSAPESENAAPANEAAGGEEPVSESEEPVGESQVVAEAESEKAEESAHQSEGEQV
eukprot:TRINITY_DN425_c0_g1_i5.p1 TRINITY_DN425_c0_g1~~TRINITY_DN425_c0_g1_i5.p1  ORF type:complete len:278 (+),score=74.99 TRINITY_DN425_c0_g1_i5:407-1240(+)